TVAAKESSGGAARNGEVDAVDGERVAKALSERAHFDHGMRHAAHYGAVARKQPDAALPRLRAPRHVAYTRPHAAPQTARAARGGMSASTQDASLRQGTRTDVSVSLRMLVLIRWVAVIGQAVTVLVVHYGLRFVLPLESALAVVATSALLNLAASWPRRGSPRLGDREASFYLAYDILQLGMLLFLTGGLQNPFAILMLAPVTVSATILSRRSVFWLSTLTVVAISVLAVFHLPLPWRDMPLLPPPLYVLGVWTALVSSTLIIAGYTWSIAEEARRMRDAFAATQLALAREQRVSAVGGIAAAAAHQLGSPL